MQLEPGLGEAATAPAAPAALALRGLDRILLTGVASTVPGALHLLAGKIILQMAGVEVAVA